MLKLETATFNTFLLLITSACFCRSPVYRLDLDDFHYNVFHERFKEADNQDDSTWQIKAGYRTYSGTIDKAFISPDKTSLYFWGTAHQTPGTILSVVANFRSKFVASVEDVSSTDISFILGKSDNSEPPILTIDPTSTEFVVIVKNYNHQTKVAHGTISGKAKDSNGKEVEIQNGKFRVQL